jgi:hypothetical protein
MGDFMEYRNFGKAGGAVGLALFDVFEQLGGTPTSTEIDSVMRKPYRNQWH